MTLLGMSPTMLAAGLGGLVMSLFVLHLLRVRPRVQVVPTLLFWREAQRETRARTVFGRFRHLRTFLFLLLTFAAFWLAIAEPEFESSRARSREAILVLDAGPSWAARTDDQRSRGARLRQVALEQLNGLGLGDRCATFVLGDNPGFLTGFKAPRPEARSVLAKDLHAPLACEIERARTIIEALKAERPRLEVRLITDRPAAWRPLAEGSVVVTSPLPGRGDAGLVGAAVGAGQIVAKVDHPGAVSPRRLVLLQGEREVAAVAIPVGREAALVALPRPVGVEGPVRLELRPSDALPQNDVLELDLGRSPHRVLRREGAASPELDALCATGLPAAAGMGGELVVAVLAPASDEGSLRAPRWDTRNLSSVLGARSARLLPSRAEWPEPAGPLRPLPPATKAGLRAMVVDDAGRPLARFAESRGSSARLELSADLVDTARHLIDRPAGAAALLGLLRWCAGAQPASSAFAADEDLLFTDLGPELERGKDHAAVSVGDPAGHGLMPRMSSELDRVEVVAGRAALAAGTLPLVDPPAPGRHVLPWEWLALLGLLLLLGDAWLHGRRRIP